MSSNQSMLSHNASSYDLSNAAAADETEQQRPPDHVAEVCEEEKSEPAHSHKAVRPPEYRSLVATAQQQQFESPEPRRSANAQRSIRSHEQQKGAREGSAKHVRFHSDWLARLEPVPQWNEPTTKIHPYDARDAQSHSAKTHHKSQSQDWEQHSRADRKSRYPGDSRALGESLESYERLDTANQR